MAERLSENFNSRLRAELFNVEMFATPRGTLVLMESWHQHYSVVRPHSSLTYRPPIPETILSPSRGLPYAPLRSAHGLARAAGH